MKKITVLFLLFACAVALTALAPFIGMKNLSPVAVLTHGGGDIYTDIFWKIRVPRVLTAFCAGAALALSGMAFQALFRNPLATPFTLGVSSGAAFGASVYVIAGIPFSLAGISGQSIYSFLGALVSIFIVYGLTQARRGFSTSTMLLAGVAVSFFFSSLIMFAQYMSDFAGSYRIIRWLMGGFEIVGYSAAMNIGPFLLTGSMFVFMLTKELNLITTGDDMAKSRGVDVKRVKTALFFATSLMVGGVVSVCGPIGFVGMMTPHICRIFIGPDHRYLAPATFMFGGMLLAVCDTIARTIIAPAEIPVGVITALLGGPFFLWLLLGGSSEHSFVSRT
ncbi:iron ABC transporter permease [bacterium]|nr:iron ABC transporter permease [bacterium]